nr:hypothetical protein Iba_chr02cCG17680 [Ipomoea batatas]
MGSRRFYQSWVSHPWEIPNKLDGRKEGKIEKTYEPYNKGNAFH